MSMPVGATSTTKKGTAAPLPSNTTDSPYLGSKISLVSKAKIRYEGILYTIDANESTVALSKVRSFGTEDRPTDRPVHARDEIFEYIIFRGADIEDLQVREPPQSSYAQDPAIVESGPGRAFNTSDGRSNTGGVSSQGGSKGTKQMSSTSPTVPSGGVSQSSSSQQTTGAQQSKRAQTNTDALRSLTVNNQQVSRPYSQQTPAAQLDSNDYSSGGGYNQGRRSGGGNRQQQQDFYDYSNGQQGSRRVNNSYNQAAAYGYNWDASWQGQQGGYRPSGQQQQRYSRQPQAYGSQGQYYPQRPRYNQNGQQQGNYYMNESGSARENYYRPRRSSTGALNEQKQNQSSSTSQRAPRQQQQQQSQQQQGGIGRERANSTRNNNTRSSLKFTGDFDFEQSNSLFHKDEIEKEIKKSLSMKTGKEDGTPKSPNKENKSPAATPPHQNDDQQQEQQENHQDADQQPYSNEQGEEEHEICYDKTKSFFDHISCEATEKERASRRNWNDERRVNAETFGLQYRPIQQGGMGGGYGSRRGGQQGGGYRRTNNYNTGNQGQYYVGGNQRGYNGGYRGYNQGGNRQGMNQYGGGGQPPRHYGSGQRMIAY